MKLAKKLLAVALAGVLALTVLTGCGSSDSKSLTADLAKEASKSEYLGYKVTANNSLVKLAEGSVKTAVKKAVNDAKAEDNITYENVIAEERSKGTTDLDTRPIMKAADAAKNTANGRWTRVFLIKVDDTKTTARAKALSDFLNKYQGGQESDGNIESWKGYTGEGYKQHNDAQLGCTTFKVDGTTYLLGIITYGPDTETTEQG